MHSASLLGLDSYLFPDLKRTIPQIQYTPMPLSRPLTVWGLEILVEIRDDDLPLPPLSLYTLMFSEDVVHELLASRVSSKSRSSGVIVGGTKTGAECVLVSNKFCRFDFILQFSSDVRGNPVWLLAAVKNPLASSMSLLGVGATAI